MISPEAIVAAARANLGTPFRHQGRIPGKALDCAGLVVVTARAVGLEPLDFAGYPRRPFAGLMEQVLDAQPCLRRVSRVPQAGDVLLMRFDGDPQHLAICAGQTIIHAWAQPGRVAENDFTPDWQRRLVAVYELIEVAA